MKSNNEMLIEVIISCKTSQFETNYETKTNFNYRIFSRLSRPQHWVGQKRPTKFHLLPKML